jgi:peptide/nickel transport system permease protein
VLALVVRRVVRLVLSLITVSLITFLLLQAAPGDFADISRVTSGATGIGSSQGSEAVVSLRERYGEDVPAWQQYLIFMRGAATWDFGPSYKYPNLSVEKIIAAAFPVSATLAVLAVSLALLLSVPLGVLAAVRRNSMWDHGTMFTITLGHSVPNYLAATILILVVSGTFQLLPARGWTGPENVIMPVLALAIGPAAVLARYVRSSLLETLREEYIVAARAKGGSSRTVITRHALRNSLIPLVTVVGPLLAALMTGTVFIENIFGIPGLGLYFTGAAISRDMPLLMGTTLFFALILMVANLLVDVAYGALDPRIRAKGGRWTWRSRPRQAPV